MIRITCTADFSQIGDFDTLMGRVLDKSIQLISEDYSDEVKREITRQHLIDHGNMKNSILVNYGYKTSEIVSGVKYLLYQNDGTGIYGKHRTPIVPKKKRTKFLVFDIAGKTYFRKSVKGVKGKKFIEKAYEGFKDGTRVYACIDKALQQCGLTVV